VPVFSVAEPNEITSVAVLGDGRVFLFDRYGRETEMANMLDALQLLRRRATERVELRLVATSDQDQDARWGEASA
jgi:hypothetical protein